MRAIIALNIFLIFISPSLCDAEKVKIGIFNLPPFMIQTGPDKKLRGAAIDYWEKYLAPKMNVVIELSGPFPIPRVVKMLEEGKVDVVINITKIPEREALFIYPETYMSEISSCLVVRNDSPIKEITKQEDLFDLKIGYIIGGFIPPLLKHERITFDLTTSTEYRQILLRKLIAKRYDAYLDINQMSLLYDLKIKGFKNKVRTIPLPVETIKVYSIFRKSEKGRRLSRMFDKVNMQYYKTDTYNNLAKRYMEH